MLAATLWRCVCEFMDIVSIANSRRRHVGSTLELEVTNTGGAGTPRCWPSPSRRQFRRGLRLLDIALSLLSLTLSLSPPKLYCWDEAPSAPGLSIGRRARILPPVILHQNRGPSQELLPVLPLKPAAVPQRGSAASLINDADAHGRLLK